MKRFSIVPLILFFHIMVFGQQAIPYSTSFEDAADTLGWSHYAVDGDADDWVFGIPDSDYFNSAHTGTSVAVTGLYENAAMNSNQALESPSFDLSAYSEEMVLSFFHRTRVASSQFDVDFAFEYSLDQGETWALLHHPEPSTQNIQNWQLSTGFFNISYDDYEYSAISLDFLQAEDDVRFRFRFHSMEESNRGWMIDDFYLRPKASEFRALQADSIWGVNPYFSEVEIVMNVSHFQDFLNSESIQTKFYHSTDTVFDDNDLLIDSVNMFVYPYSTDFDRDIYIPEGLSPGYQYIFYQLDADNQFEEPNELDNISYAVMNVDSTYELPYRDNFEGENQWGIGPLRNNSTYATGWKRGEYGYFHLESPRSGGNAWHSSRSSNGKRLESPLLDLSQTEDNVMCFWFRSSYYGFFSSFLSVELPEIENELGTINDFPYNSIIHSVPNERDEGWECYCRELSEYQREDFRFRLYGSGSWYEPSVRRTMVDDIYIGPALPDLAINNEKEFLFTTAEVETDTLYYRLFNGGLTETSESVTAFYWSTDSLLDSEDQLLGLQTEAALEDTSFVDRQFTYVKPSDSEGIFYLIYHLDHTNDIEEMWEEDNIGYFRLEQLQTTALPYFNDFEENADRWVTNSTVGNNDWRLNTPDGEIFQEAFSGSKAWVTSDTGLVSYYSRMHIVSPIFDLTQLETPILEFNTLIDNGNSSRTGSEMMYSINGGHTWQSLEPTTDSYRRWYRRLTMSGTGNDVHYFNPYSILNIALNSEGTFQSSLSYQGKNYDEITKVSVELDELKDESQIRFMIIYLNTDIDSEGMMFDDFSISEGVNDLKVVSDKSLMVSSEDPLLRTDLVLKNDANHISDRNSVHVLLSVDESLGTDDLLLGSHEVDKMKPYEKFYFNINYDTPDNYADFNYLLLVVDPLNEILETDETNNFKALPLAMDTNQTFNLPLVFDFEEEYIDGWTWYHDSTGYDGYRFRSQLVNSDRAPGAESGTYFLDPVLTNNIEQVPFMYLESPAFDFSNASIDSVAFDLRCIGRHTISNQGEGGNLEYSTNGIDWFVLGFHNDQQAQNWYDFNGIQSLGGQSGWVQFVGWQHCGRAISYLSDESFVKFRFKHRSVHQIVNGGPRGLHLDNFSIVGTTLYTVVDEVSVCPGDSVQIFDDYIFEPGLYLDTLETAQGTDSVVGIQVNELPSYYFSDDYTLCAGESFNFPDGSSSQPLYSDTVLNQFYSSINFCDSVYAFNIEIPQINAGLLIDNGAITAQENDAQYQWFDCNNGFAIIEGETGQTFSPQANGSYALGLTVYSCVDTSDCVTITTTGLNNFAQQEFDPFPNPCADYITFAFDDLGAQGCVLSISSVDGKQMESIQISKGNAIKRVSTENYGAGLYIYYVTYDGVNVGSGKFVVGR